MKSLLSSSFRPCLFYEILFIQIFSCQHLICLKVFLNRLIYNFLWKCPVVVRICFQPVTGKLFVKRWLSMSGFITVSRPETGTVRSEHLISNYHISIFIKSELKFCICMAALFAPLFLKSLAYTVTFAAAGIVAGATGQKQCARLCHLYFEGARLCGSVLVLYFFMVFLSTALLLLAGNGGFG